MRICINLKKYKVLGIFKIMINVKSPLDSLSFNNLQLDRRDEKFGYENEILII